MARSIRENKLNDLSGKEWIKFTKSWFIHVPPPRDRKILHPASFPETLAAEFIRFFTKKGQWVLDPFLGTGSVLLAAQENFRNGVGIEIYPEYAELAKTRLGRKQVFYDVREVILVGDSRRIVDLFEENDLPSIDFCMTSPPYWNQLKRNYVRQKERSERGLDTIYGNRPEDIGNIDNYKEFVGAQRCVFDAVFEVMKDFGYLVVVTNNVFVNGRVWPLAFDTATCLCRKWVMKDEKIWCQDDKILHPFGMYNAWVGNRAHQYCFVFRKEPIHKPRYSKIRRSHPASIDRCEPTGQPLFHS